MKRLREDEDIKELYDDDVAVYIETWEVNRRFQSDGSRSLLDHKVKRAKKFYQSRTKRGFSSKEEGIWVETGRL